MFCVQHSYSLLTQTTQQEWGWEVFQSIEKYLKTQYGYGSLKNVNNENSVEDRMESFFMAETLKYLYLLFDPDSEIDILKKVCLVFLSHVYSQWSMSCLHLTYFYPLILVLLCSTFSTLRLTLQQYFKTRLTRSSTSS